MDVAEMKLEDFCSKDETRQKLLKPFTFRGHTYATDGRAMVRVDGVPGYDVDDEAAYERYTEIFTKWMLHRERDWIPFDDAFKYIDPEEAKKTTDHSRCASCIGFGKVTKECSRCKGYGSIVCPTCDNEGDCEMCKAKGVLPTEATCPDCDGSGMTGLWKGANTIDERFVNRFKRFGALEYGGTKGFENLFRFQGGYGLIMGMRV